MLSIHSTRSFVPAVLSLLATIFLSVPAARAQHGHEGNGEGEKGKVKAAAWAGDAYTLPTDPVTGERLGEKGAPVCVDHEGRSLCFASDENAKKFKASPEKYLMEVDAKMVEQQLPLYPTKKCVVTGDELGGEMGDPINVVYKNRLVRLCCDDCLPMLKESPGKYIALLDQEVIAAQKPAYSAKTCPVSGKALGSMGEPVDYVAGNRLVRFCCSSCIRKFNAEASKFLAAPKAGGSEQNGAPYVCSMHPEVSQDKPGKCPKCGMELKQKKS